MYCRVPYMYSLPSMNSTRSMDGACNLFHITIILSTMVSICKSWQTSRWGILIPSEIIDVSGEAGLILEIRGCEISQQGSWRQYLLVSRVMTWSSIDWLNLSELGLFIYLLLCCTGKKGWCNPAFYSHALWRPVPRLGQWVLFPCWVILQRLWCSATRHWVWGCE